MPKTPLSQPTIYEEALHPFDEAVFLNPPAVYRGGPFRVWNCRPNSSHLLRQFDTLASKDDQRIGSIAFDLHMLRLDGLTGGHQALDLTVFGSRINSFGAEWTEGYILRPTGILVAPMLQRIDTPPA